jgi:hypothetical protein
MIEVENLAKQFRGGTLLGKDKTSMRLLQERPSLDQYEKVFTIECQENAALHC